MSIIAFQSCLVSKVGSTATSIVFWSQAKDENVTEKTIKWKRNYVWRSYWHELLTFTAVFEDHLFIYYLFQDLYI